MPQANVPTTMA